MALVPCATASLMQVVCCWTSPLLSQTATFQPYCSAFFWYIFQEKACDGLSIWATNVRVGFSPDGASVAAGASVAPAGASVAGALELVLPPQAATRTAATDRVASVIRVRFKIALLTSRSLFARCSFRSPPRMSHGFAVASSHLLACRREP